jgi:hypothetical protein
MTLAVDAIVDKENAVPDTADEHESPKSRNDLPAPITPEQPYSLFSRGDKWLIITLIAVAGALRYDLPCPSCRFSSANDRSPLTANIYFPALPILADAFETNQERMNLSVTIYMVFQGICECFNVLMLTPG